MINDFKNPPQGVVKIDKEKREIWVADPNSFHDETLKALRRNNWRVVLVIN